MKHESSVAFVDPFIARFVRSVRRDLPVIEAAGADRADIHQWPATDVSKPFNLVDESIPAFVRRQAE